MTDVGNRAAVDALIAEAGPVDILVNNAGGVGGQVGRPVEEVAEADWQAILQVNLTGAFICAQAAVPGMCVGGGMGAAGIFERM